MHGVLLTGGFGTRLAPMTSILSKHLLDIAGKPMIDYPIQTLIQSGVRHITVVVGSSFSGQILDYVQDGSKYDVDVNYVYQSKPLGIAHAISLCQEYVGTQQFAVMLGDNIFQRQILWGNKNGINNPHSAKIQLYRGGDQKRFGVATIDKNRKIIKLEEKPVELSDRYQQHIITGCYMFDRTYFDKFRNIKPSARGEYEVIEILQQYLNEDSLEYSFVDGFWSDAGQFESIEECRKVMR